MAEFLIRNIMLLKFLKYLLISLLSMIIAIALFVLVVNIHMTSFASGYIFNDVNEAKTNFMHARQTVIVLGAGVYADGTPSPMLRDRLENGINAYNSGIADRILLTGDHGKQYYDEVNSMKDYVLGSDIPKEDVYLDHAGFSTYDSMVRAAKVFKVETAFISTQGFHLARAVYIARKNGIDAYGINADLRQYPRSELTGYIMREWLARTKDFIFVNILKPDPIFLGEELPITGDSSATYD